ncbi:metallophosphoesterase [Phenylobacterium sp.]|uniref:metallophosphoesterase family protein n=1 Tax=Phenylobacterium sp. TaxID=1871053 RepID=UPI002F3EB702
MFRLAHFSDPHLPSSWTPDTARDVVSKRALSRLAWRRKRSQHDPAVLALLTADVAAHAPDHIAVTGDLTNFSTPEEFERARTWLSTLGPADRVTVSPGNHDALVDRGLAARLERLRPWFGDTDGEAFPHVRRRGPVALVNLSTATPTPPALATGALGAAQLARLAAGLEAAAQAGLARVVMLHHPPVEGVVSRRKALDDAAALRAVLRDRGAELVLHGHGHESVFGALAGPVGPIPVLGAPSASSPGGRHAPAGWHAIEIEPGAGGPSIRVTVRGLDAAAGKLRELGRYVLLPLTSGIAA